MSIILGETGSGKSTQLVQYLHESWIRGTGKIVCTQPRKIAAISLATRVAQEMGGKVGQLVGYKVGQDSKMSQATRILYVTDQILLNECLKDPIFVQYSCIIIDEAHERSIFTDLLLGFVRRALVKREDLHVIITSATIDPDVFVEYFRKDNVPPVLRISGRTFPVDEFYESKTSEDYLTAACEKVVWVHENEPPGDVLVFLTTPLETEKSCGRVAHLQGIMACELNGRLQPQEQQKVFDPTPNDKRKVVFATNSAETSVTIPGVKYVIDTGRVNEVSYDAKRNMSSLNVTWVTQSSANQRKGRAGRTESGKCYRLYTVEEYNGFRINSVPEIKRVHLGQALLKLFMLGIKDPESFEFVEPPSTDGIQNALAVLRELGAYDCHGITDIGTKMAKLPLEPRLGKVALLGIDKGIAYECVTMCSICSAGSVFFRGGAEEEKQLADMKKTKFCDERGEMITFVNCYKEWNQIPDKMQSRWCVENSINGKTMKSAKRALMDIVHMLRQDLGIDIKKEYSNDPDVNSQLAKIIFECYPSNLCRYSGHQREGYCQAIAPKTVTYIHPSSALYSMEELPKWVVYQQLMTTSKTFMQNVTYVDESWVHEKLAEGHLPIRMESIEEEVMERKLICGISSNIAKIMKENRAQKLRNMKEELLSKFSPHTKFIVDIERDVLLVLYANPNVKEEASVYVNSFVREISSPLKKETLETPIRPNSEVRFLMENGGSIRTILMKKDTRKIQIKNVSERYSEEEVINILQPFGEIERIDRNTELHNWGVVTFDLPESAQRASMTKLPNMIMDISLVDEIIPAASKGKFQDFSVKVIGCRRKVLGFGFVTFTNIDRSSALSQLPNPLVVSKETEKGQQTASIDISANTKNELQARLKNIPEWADPFTIKNHLDSYFTTSDPLPIIKVSIPREKAPDRDLSKTISDRMRSFIQTELQSVADNFEITMIQPKDDDFTFMAFVKFSDASIAQQAAEILNEKPFNGAPIEARMNLKLSYIVWGNIYKMCEEDVQKEMSTIKEESERSIKMERTQRKNGSYLVKVETETFDDMREVKKRLDPLLNGQNIKLNSYEFMKISSRRWRKDIESKVNESNTRIRIDERQQSVILYGRRQNIEQAEQIIVDSLKFKDEEVIKDIPLKGVGYPKGITKALILEYGYNMEKMKEISDASYVELVLKKHMIKFQGSDKSLEMIKNMIDEKAATIPNDGNPETSNQSFECPVCFDSVNLESCYVVQYCGHLYCTECAKDLVNNSVMNNDFPITCAHDKCSERLVLDDLRNLYPVNKFQSFSDAALRSLVSTHPQQFAFCSTPDCPIVYKKSTGPDGEEFVCSECQFSLCTNCGLRYDIHRGMSCSAYKNMNNTDQVKNTWLQGDTINRSLCPNCKTGIEKDGGCNRVGCAACKAQICWKCKQWFQTSTECYQHLTDKHGGCFDVI